MRSILLGAAAALGLFPAMVSAAVVRIDSQLYDSTGLVPLPATPIVPLPTQQTVLAEIFGTDLDGADERLTAVTIRAIGEGFSTTTTGSAPRFQFPTPASAARPTQHPYVFGLGEGGPASEIQPPVENFGTQPNRLQFGITVVGQDDEVNIVNPPNGHRDGFIKVPIIIPANATPGTYSIRIDLSGSQIAGAGAPITVQAGPAATFTIVPEPASMGLIVLGGLLALRRRRVA